MKGKKRQVLTCVLVLGLIITGANCSLFEKSRNDNSLDFFSIIGLLLGTGGQSCGVPVSSTRLLMHQHLLGGGFGEPPWDFASCRPGTGSTTLAYYKEREDLMSLGAWSSLSDDTQVSSEFSFTNGRVSQEVRSANLNISAGTGANSVTGCPSGGSDGLDVVVSMTRTYERDGDGYLNKASSRSYCSGTQDQTAGAVQEIHSVYTNGRLTSRLKYRNLDQSDLSDPGTSIASNPMERITVSYDDINIPTRITLTRSFYYVDISSSNSQSVSTDSSAQAGFTVNRENAEIQSISGSSTCYATSLNSSSSVYQWNACSDGGALQDYFARADITTSIGHASNLYQNSVTALTSTEATDASANIAYSFGFSSNGLLSQINYTQTSQGSAGSSSSNNTIQYDSGTHITSGFDITATYEPTISFTITDGGHTATYTIKTGF